MEILQRNRIERGCGASRVRAQHPGRPIDQPGAGGARRRGPGGLSGLARHFARRLFQSSHRLASADARAEGDVRRLPEADRRAGITATTSSSGRPSSARSRPGTARRPAPACAWPCRRPRATSFGPQLIVLFFSSLDVDEPRLAEMERAFAPYRRSSVECPAELPDDPSLRDPSGPSPRQGQRRSIDRHSSTWTTLQALFVRQRACLRYYTQTRSREELRRPSTRSNPARLLSSEFLTQAIPGAQAPGKRAGAQGRQGGRLAAAAQGDPGKLGTRR